jgi:hypothetical protein
MTTSDLQNRLGCSAATVASWADEFSSQSSDPIARNKSDYRIFNQQQMGVIVQAFLLKKQNPSMTREVAIHVTLREAGLLRDMPMLRSAQANLESPHSSAATIQSEVSDNSQTSKTNLAQPRNAILSRLLSTMKRVLFYLNCMVSLEANPLWKMLDRQTQYKLAVHLQKLFFSALLCAGAIFGMAIAILVLRIVLARFGATIPVAIPFLVTSFATGWIACAMHLLVVLPMRGEKPTQD